MRALFKKIEQHEKKAKTKKCRLRYLLIFTLCFGMLFTLYCCMSGEITALAKEQAAALSKDEEEQSQNEAAWYNEQGELAYGSFEEAIVNVSANGTVILLSDISLAKEMTISKPMTITSWDANFPCIIKNKTKDTDDKKEIGRIFTVDKSQLILKDIILDGGKNDGVTACHPLICLTNGAIMRMLAGSLLTNAENQSQTVCGGGVNIRSGQLYMYDGSMITNCKARHGGGVEVNSKDKTYSHAVFGMAGGNIKNCEAYDGGGVYVNIGQFQMLGGRVSDNNAYNSGGGIYAAGERYTAAVRIVNGEIASNTAVSGGGGIFADGGYALLQIDGGTFEKNSAKTGGGVSMILGTLNLYGGTITENTAGLYGGGVLGSPDSVIYMQGNPKVFDNTANDKEDSFDNLYLDGADDYGYPTSPIRLIGSLTDGVKLGMSRWVRPDNGEHPYRQMIVPYNGYNITQDDFNRLCCDRLAENKELYADNMEKYAFIPYNGEIVMVLAVDVKLDKESLSFEGINTPAELINEIVTPDNAPEKGVTWHSSDEHVAAVDETGNVTPIGEGKAVVTAISKSPYHASASCSVTVGYQLTVRAKHGTVTYTPDWSDGFFLSGQQITLNVAADEEYRLYSLKAYKTNEESEEVIISDDNVLTMPNHDVTVEAVFEPIPYEIGYRLNGGELKEGVINPDYYTIESGEITLNNPVKSGYTFVGWTGTDLTEAVTVVKIPAGSTGEREYTAVWEESSYQLTIKVENGTSDTAGGFFLSNEEIAINFAANKGYKLYSFKVYRTNNEVDEIIITDNVLTMPNHDVTVEAVFKPIIYSISCDLGGGKLEYGMINPDTYTIESSEITINNPVKSGYTFVGWTGTDLTETEPVVKIPAGSTGARKYTAVWEEENKPIEAPTEKPSETSSEKPIEAPTETPSEKPTETPSEAQDNTTENTDDDTSEASAETSPYEEGVKISAVTNDTGQSAGKPTDSVNISAAADDNDEKTTEYESVYTGDKMGYSAQCAFLTAVSMGILILSEASVKRKRK